MDQHTSHELAYQNGYSEGHEKGYKEGFLRGLEDGKPKWIPASEPPEENGYYWCYVLTSAIGDKATYEQMKLFWEDDVWLYRHNSYRMCRNVTHWMPLPTPPKGE